ncbi:hypothetical protein TNCV_3420461 [Trichonephila clavipes]|nr:hypothetical protein TNCV_3420461 [Trichonephila clavipes]
MDLETIKQNQDTVGGALEWRHHRSPPPQFRHGAGRGGKYFPAHCIRGFSCDSPQERETFGPPDLTNTYSMCTRKVFDDIRHRTQAFRSGV